MPALYAVVRDLLVEAGCPAVSESECVARLGRCVTRSSVLTAHYGKLFPSTRFDVAMLPLVSRLLGRTVGVIDVHDAVVPVPHQWFDPNDDGDGDGDADSGAPADVEILRRTSDGGYERDFDNEYTTKYDTGIREHQWTFTTDAESLGTLVGVFRDTSAEDVVPDKVVVASDTIPAAAATASAASAASATGVRETKATYEQVGTQLYDVWCAKPPFVAHHDGPFPSVLDADFQPKIYRCPGLRPQDLCVRRENDNDGEDGFVTLRDHQQFVRNYLSPFTPYHSLLLVHATGTGKTLTTFGVTEAFRDYICGQGKRIHIACPRDEVRDEFRQYVRQVDGSGAAAYVRHTYDDEDLATRNDHRRALLPGYAYRIENHQTIFERDLRKQVGQLQLLVARWNAVFPSATICRLHDLGGLGDPEDSTSANRVPSSATGRVTGFRIQCAVAVSDAELARLEREWTTIESQFKPFFGEQGLRHSVASRTDTLLVVHVTGIRALVNLEAEVVATYANTVFVMDEAHNYVTPSAQAEQTEDADAANWRVTLSVVTGILHLYHQRMRLILLTATPMTNSATDLYALLNLLIRNDGWDEPRLETNERRSLSSDHADRLRQCLRTRVSCFESDAGKPTQLPVDAMWYNVPVEGPVQVVVGPPSCPTHVVCAPGTFDALVASFERGTEERVHGRVHKDGNRCSRGGSSSSSSSSSSVAAPPSLVVTVDRQMDPTAVRQAYRRMVHEEPHATRRHVYVCFPKAPTDTAVTALVSVAAEWSVRDVVHLLANDHAVAKVVANTGALRGLYAHVSEHRPLWFPRPKSVVRSMHACDRPPMLYAAHNLPRFFRTYLDAKVTDARDDVAVVATPVRNRALLTTCPAHERLRYNYAHHSSLLWNPTDKADVVYHPKVDTMLELMERHSGNVFVYVNHAALDPTGYSRTLMFLKRVIERRFRGVATSRLRNVYVDILHKETIRYQDRDRDQKNNASDELPTALNERAKQLHTHFLSKREDVVLLGSKEVMEGLTLREVRQVHVLDPTWHYAAFEQVLGRAIRIGSHQRKTPNQRNTTCFLHVTVPEHPGDPALDAPTTAVPTRGRMPRLARLVGDLHKYYQMHKKIADIVHVGGLLRTHAVDSVYRDWSPLHGVTNVLRLAGASWCTQPALSTPRVVQRDHDVRARREAYGFLVSVGTVGHEDAPTALPLSRHALRSEIDWYKRQVVRMFEQAHSSDESPQYTVADLRRRVIPYGAQHVVVAQPLSVAVDVEAVARMEPATRPEPRSKTTPLALGLEDLLAHPTLAAKTAYLSHLAEFQWHTTVGPGGYTLVVDAASVGTALARCKDVSATTVAAWASCGTVPVTALAHKTRRERFALPPSLVDVVTQLCEPKRLETTEVPRMFRSQTYGDTRRQRRVHARQSRRAPKTEVVHGLRVQNVHPEALAYALDELVAERAPVQYLASVPTVVVYQAPHYTLERLDVPATQAAWYLPSPDGSIGADPPPYSVMLATTTDLTPTALGAMVQELYAVVQWATGCATGCATSVVHPRRSETPLQPSALEEYAFDALCFAHQDALLQYVAIHGFPADTTTHAGLYADVAVHKGFALLRRMVSHRYAEKQPGHTTPAVEALLKETFPGGARGRIYCSMPRNPATEHCSIHAYVQLRHTGKATETPYTELALPANLRTAWVSYFSPVPVEHVGHHHSPGARFRASTHPRLDTTSSQPPLQSTSRWMGYGQVLNYKHREASKYAFRCVDATLCDQKSEHEGIPMDDPCVASRFAETDPLYVERENTWVAATHATPPPPCNYVDFHPLVCARTCYLRDIGAYTRYFFTGVLAKHLRTKQLYSGWRERKK